MRECSAVIGTKSMVKGKHVWFPWFHESGLGLSIHQVVNNIQITGDTESVYSVVTGVPSSSNHYAGSGPSCLIIDRRRANCARTHCCCVLSEYIPMYGDWGGKGSRLVFVWKFCDKATEFSDLNIQIILLNRFV